MEKSYIKAHVNEQGVKILAQEYANTFIFPGSPLT